MKRMGQDHQWTKEFNKFIEYRKLMKQTGRKQLPILYYIIPGGVLSPQS